MPKIAAVVVLYNPDPTLLANIESYSNQIDKLYVVDNSDKIENSLIDNLKCFSKTEYIPNKTNIGIAAALNIGANKAIEEGFDFLLTMDQDSEASGLMVAKLLECFSQELKIAVVAPIVQHKIGKRFVQKTDKPCEQIYSAWTSGNLIDLNVVKAIGGFNEELFIDYVDHEFCLRINKMGFKIYKCNKTHLKHSLGRIEEINLIFRKVYPTNHSAIRLYYRTRNRFYVKKIYKNVLPEFFKEDDIQFWKGFLKAILFEENKIKKIKFCLMGYNDYKKNKLGKFEQ